MAGAEAAGQTIQEGAEPHDQDAQGHELPQPVALQADFLTCDHGVDQQHQGRHGVLQAHAERDQPGWPIRGQVEHVARLLARALGEGRQQATEQVLHRVSVPR